MKESYSYHVNGRELYVLDNCFSKAAIEAIARRMSQGPHTRLQADRPDTRKNLAFATHFELGQILDTFLGQTVCDVVERYFPGDGLKPFSFYCNMGLYGDSAYTHRDCDPKAKNVTALLFANPKWDIDWGGETLFYNDKGDCITGVNPKPGRIALFRGAITHRPGLVIRECYTPRFTIACKFRVPTPTAQAPATEAPAPVSARPLCRVHRSIFCGCQEKLAKQAAKQAARQTAKRAVPMMR